MNDKDSWGPSRAGLLIVLVVVSVAAAGLAFVVVREREAIPPVYGAASIPVVLAAGDIARCGNDADSRVADLLDDLVGTVVTLGDNAYPSGTLQQFQDCYDPSWGRHRDRTRPALGNHDYDTRGATGYFTYFGTRAGDPDKGYYSYGLGEHWWVVVLNTNCDDVPGGCGEGSPQMRWLEAQLGANADKNVLAYWHHARFSSGVHGSSRRTEPFWALLHEHAADLVLVSHDHHYERFARLDANGDPDPAGGIRQFVVGTGGGQLREFPGAPLPTTEVRDADTHGVLRVELHPSSYRWEFLPTDGSDFTDAGSSPVNTRDAG